MFMSFLKTLGTDCVNRLCFPQSQPPPNYCLLCSFWYGLKKNLVYWFTREALQSILHRMQSHRQQLLLKMSGF
jgi:hypothetical protein